MQLAYYPGCSLKQSSHLYDVQTRRVCQALGAELKEIEDWNCCGATSASKVDDFLALAMPARNIGIAETAGFDRMVIPCSACYSRTRVAQAAMAEDPQLAERINDGLAQKAAGAVEILSILELLDQQLQHWQKTATLPLGFKGLTPVCYYGCMLTRFPRPVSVADSVENPRKMEGLLVRLGLDSLDWNHKTSCCGASAAVNDSPTAFELMARIMEDALARGANCLVTACPMCQMNLDAYQDGFCHRFGIQPRLPVFFITELVGLALGIDAAELQLERHFVDTAGLIKEMDPV
jgi:heterodisulfide reductase subunit B2